MKIVSILAAGLLAAGCSAQKDAASAGVSNTPPSGAQAIIDDMTGHTTVKVGKQTMEKVRDVSAEKNQQLEEVMGK